MKLTPRLKLISEKVDLGDKIVDVGTDHAYIPIYLTINNIIKSAIASDVKTGPLERAKKNIEKFNLQSKIITLKSNGLEKISLKDIDKIIIAGMGGILISEILSKSIKKIKQVKKIILQPMQFVEELRNWIYDNGYTIIDEEMVKEDNKIYTILVIEQGNDKVEDDFFYYIGKNLIEKNDPLLKEFIIKEIKRYRKILHNISYSAELENSKVEISSINRLEKLINIYSQLYGGMTK